MSRVVAPNRTKRRPGPDDRLGRAGLEILAEAAARIGHARLDAQSIAGAIVRLVVEVELADSCAVHFPAPGDGPPPLLAAHRLQDPFCRTEAPSDGHASGVSLSLPLMAGGRMIGALTAGRRAPRPPFEEQDQRVLQEIAHRVALSLENVLLYQRAQQEGLRAAAANRAKDEFLAMLGHELRNPLAPIASVLQMIQLRGDGRCSEHERAIIERQLHHLSKMVDDLLDISRVSCGKISLDLTAVDLARVVGKAVEAASPQIEQRRHLLLVDLGSGELWVQGDELRLAQVIANLLTNAAKFTEPGGRIEVRGRQEGGEVELSVRDNGVGMEAELLPLVFDLFIQGQQDRARSGRGLGLGLGLARSLIDLHGGRIWASSEGVGRGSEITLRLPASKRPQPTALAGSPRLVVRVPRRVLVVDDNKDGAEMLAEALIAVGHQVEVALDPLSALEAFARFQPEVAVVDLGLPVMDGYQLASRMRELAGSTRLLAVTGYGQDADRVRSRQAGFDVHLVKPVDLAVLTRWIER